MFQDREEAAERLTQVLQKYQGQDAIILAVPRGGVPIAKKVSDSLNIPMDISLIKKIGHPENKEYAIGAVGLHRAFLRKSENSIPSEYINAEIERIRIKLRKIHERYMGSKEPLSITDKIVIIIDDGIATGSTLIATVHQVRDKGARKIIVAAPVGPLSAVRKLREVADEVICLEMPDDFRAVGQYYVDFDEVKDNDIITMLHDELK